jgi:hypothetical protein
VPVTANLPEQPEPDPAISWKLGRRLKFDPAKEQFIGDDEANALCSYQRRASFTV